MAVDARSVILTLVDRINQSVLGQEAVAEGLALALLCNGNILLEGLPGTAKTRSIKTLAGALGVTLGRIQFTPDLLPADITGSDTFIESDAGGQLRFEPGPIFNELVLADEINRAPAKVQSALLEAMEERQVTVSGRTYPLPSVFLVMATQNPIEQEGTYPLPEAQTDRFLFKLRVNYPDAQAELDILHLLKAEETQADNTEGPLPLQAIIHARSAAQRVTITETVERYIVDLVMATRHATDSSSTLAHWIATGASPRASIALHRASRARAWLAGRDYVRPDDVQALAPAVLRHRLLLSYDAFAEGIDADQVIQELLATVAVG